MTPEAQRIAIAKACGWHSFKMIPQPHGSWLPEILWGMSPGMKATNLPTEIVPDYLNDLNAMNEAEKVMTWDQQKTFISHLIGLEGRDGDALWTLAWDSAWLCSSATAAQRAEAFLRTLNLWKD